MSAWGKTRDTVVSERRAEVHILIVTDRPSGPMELEELLSQRDHTVECASPEEARERVKTADPSAIVVDMADRQRLLCFLKELGKEGPGLSKNTIVMVHGKDPFIEELLFRWGFKSTATYRKVPAIIDKLTRDTALSRAFPLLYILLAMIATFLIWPAGSGTAREPTRCVSCHEDVHREAISAKYRHSVVTDQKCARCHIIEPTNWNPNLVEQAISKEYTTEALIPLKDMVEENKKYTLKVVAWDETSRRSAPITVELEPENITPFELEPPSTLSVQNIRVEEIRHGVFSTATISWQTNEFTRGAVEYGEDKKYINVTPWEYSYSREHRVTLKGLKKGRRYYYRIILKDVFGNMIRSSEMILDIEEPRYPPQRRSSIARGFPSIERAEPVSIQGYPFLLVVTDRPSRVTVTLKSTADDKTHGDGFLPPKTAQIDVCIECHRQGVSHPVGISANSPSTVIPKNLPTLEGGIITCVTCHYPHGSDKPFFARMDFERDICIECHRKGPFI